MPIPVMRGLIERRLLLNYRIEPAAIKQSLPPPFRPKLVHGFAIGGICLIRLKALRPRFLPLPVGVGSENAAHRIAVEWDDDGETREGVYIPRRDTNSRFNTWAGGKVFPGLHHHAKFVVRETADHFHVALKSDDGVTRVEVDGSVTDEWPANSVFPSLEDASRFFEGGSLGYSATRRPGRYDGLQLHCRNWRMETLAVERVLSSFFEDESRFPRGTVNFDCALLMRGIDHEWHARQELCCAMEPVGA